MIKLCLGDITQSSVETIVNSIHPQLINKYEGGIDGLIKSKCGPKLTADFKNVLGDEEAKEFGFVFMTNSYNMRCEKIIHIVTPRTELTTKKPNFNEECLRKCYIDALDLAKKNNIKEIMFPNLCTGYYKQDKTKVARIAVKAISEWQENNKDYKLDIYIDSYEEQDMDINEKVFNELGVEYDICNLPTVKKRQ